MLRKNIILISRFLFTYILINVEISKLLDEKKVFFVNNSINFQLIMYKVISSFAVYFYLSGSTQKSITAGFLSIVIY